MVDTLRSLLEGTFSWPDPVNELVAAVAVALGIVLVALVVYGLLKTYLVRLVQHLIQKTSVKWDDILVEVGFFRRLAQLVPAVIVYVGFQKVFATRGLLDVAPRLAYAWLVLQVARSLATVITAADRFYTARRDGRQQSLRGYAQAAKIVLYALTVIFMAASLLGKSPWGLVSVLGGMTAVLMLVFKDTILGFVASVQLNSYDMLRVGDWIVMPKYGADGDVVDITVNTVKVQNWDKTLTTVPTYALISESFQNWRGMFESGGRRIKRCLFVDMNTVTFCTPEMLERFRKFEILRAYLDERQGEIAADNEKRGVDTSEVINGRRQTNLGVFRAYIAAYLHEHPQVNRDMTFLVRHLEPTPKGLPIQLYVFCKDQRWAFYEAIQADIFDHLLAAIGEFDLRVFQEPSGADFARLG